MKMLKTNYPNCMIISRILILIPDYYRYEKGKLIKKKKRKADMIVFKLFIFVKKLHKTVILIKAINVLIIVHIFPLLSLSLSLQFIKYYVIILLFIFSSFYIHILVFHLLLFTHFCC